MFARVSAFRDFFDGPQFDDQGIVNTDPRNIAVPDGFINLIPTDIRGLTFSRTPQMVRSVTFWPTSACFYFCLSACCSYAQCLQVVLWS